MKNLIYKTIIILFFLLSLNTSNLYSQFTVASVGSTAAASGATGVRNTGNDIRRFTGYTLRVTVWDSNNSSPGIRWSDGTNSRKKSYG